MIYILTSSDASFLPEVLLLAESAAEVFPAQRFVWLVSSSWSSRLESAVQAIPGATAERWEPRFPASPPKAEIPHALLEIASRPDCTWALYCSPNLLWMSRPTEILSEGYEGDVVLVPTLIRPQVAGGVPVSELEALMQGVFTPRFVAVRPSAESRAFLDWWRKRLLEIPIGNRSPDSWLHLAPALFPSVRILRSPRFNVHRGNLHERQLDGIFPRITIDGTPVAYFDLGAPGELPPSNAETDPQTQRAFQSVVYWHKHRLNTLARS